MSYEEEFLKALRDRGITPPGRGASEVDAAPTDETWRSNPREFQNRFLAALEKKAAQANDRYVGALRVKGSRNGLAPVPMTEELPTSSDTAQQEPPRSWETVRQELDALEEQIRTQRDAGLQNAGWYGSNIFGRTGEILEAAGDSEELQVLLNRQKELEEELAQYRSSETVQQELDALEEQISAQREADLKKTGWYDVSIFGRTGEMLEAAGDSEELQVLLNRQKELEEELARYQYKEQQYTVAKEERMMAKDLEDLGTWTKEEQELLHLYAVYRIGNTNIIPGYMIYSDDIKKLKEKYGEERVKEIAESYSRYSNQQMMQGMQEAVRKSVDNGPLESFANNVGAVAANLAGTVAAPLGYLSESFKGTGRYSTLDPNAVGNMGHAFSGTVRGETAANIEEWAKTMFGDELVGRLTGETLSTLYNAGSSAVDNLLRIAAGGKVGSLALAATGSFGQTVSQASAQGADPVQAVALGIVTGGLEVLTEKVSLDNLLKQAKGGFMPFKEAMKAAIIAGGVEVSEEELNFLCSTLAEAAILQEKSAYNQQIQELVAGGMSHEEAKEQANRALVEQATQTAIESFLSGGMMSGATTLYTNTLTRMQGGQNGSTQTPQEGAEAPQTAQNPAEETAQEQEEAPVSPAEDMADRLMPVQSALTAYRNNGSVSGRLADIIAGLSTARQELTEKTGIEITGTKAQQRNAVRQAIAALAEQQDTAKAQEEARARETETEEARKARYANESIRDVILGPVQNAAPTETNAVSNPIDSYPAEKQNMIRSYIQAVDGKIKSFVERVKSGDLTFKRQKISDVSARAAADIERILGIDVSSYTHNINTNGVQHILKRHGANGKADRSMALDEDIARVGWVLENYDSVEPLTENGEQVYSEEFLDGEHNPVPQIKFVKKIDGSYYVVEAACENNYKKLWVQSVYLQKNNGDVTEVPAAGPSADHEDYARGGLPSPSPDNIIAEKGRDVNGETGMDHGAVGAAELGFSPKEAAIRQHGAIPEGENPVRSDQLPASVTGEDRVSHTARTALEAQVTPDEFAELIENETMRGGFSFIPITNDESVQVAQQTIMRDGWESARANWTAAVHNGRTGPNITARGALLYNHAVNSGNYQEAMDILLDYSQAVRNSARGLQAARILKRLTPENRLHMIRRSIQRMVEDMHLNREITIDEGLARRYQETRDDAEADRILDEIAADVARQIPPTLGERITALRYLNMLGNFRTQVRNLSGNLGAKATYLAKDEIAATIEALASRLSGGRFQRTKVHRVDRATRNVARADFENVADWVSGGGRANDRGIESDDFARRVQENRRILPTGLEQYRRATNWAMNNEHFGDAAFGREAYARALAGYLNARGIRTDSLDTVDRGILDQAREYAVRQAQEATFRDNNQVSDFVSRALRGRNTPAWARVIGEAIMPFRKTPANVLVRAEEFSPLGLINSAFATYQAARGDISGAELVESWAKTLTGTGLFAMGWALANMGYLRGGPDQDEEKAEFDELKGYQDYAILLPDGTSFTIDFLSPAAIPMFLGAQFDGILKDGDLGWADLEGVFSALADPMIEMSMLSGVNDTIDAIRYADNSMGQFLINATTNYLTQALGNTLLGQMERSTEESRMTTYIDKDSDVPVWLQRNLGKLSQKIPGWDYQQTPYIDQWGQEQKNPEGIANWLYQLLSPAYVDKANVDNVARELYRLNEVQSDVNVFPQSPESSLTYTDKDGNRHENYNLSAGELDTLKRTEGQTQARIVAELIRDGGYEALTDAQKAKAISLAYDYAREFARGRVLQGYDGMDGWMKGIEGDESEAIIRKVTTGAFSDAFEDLTAAWNSGNDSAGAVEALEAAYRVYKGMKVVQRKAIAEEVSGRVADCIAAMDAGVDADTFAGLYQTYYNIGKSGEKPAEQANNWAYELQTAVENGTITQKQRDILKENMTISSGYTVETEKFDAMVESGLKADTAGYVNDLMRGIEPQKGYSAVRPVQQAEAIAGAKLTEKEKIAVMKLYMNDTQDKNLDQMLGMGYDVGDYVKAYRVYADNGKKADFIAAMMALGCSKQEAESLYNVFK